MVQDALIIIVVSVLTSAGFHDDLFRDSLSMLTRGASNGLVKITQKVCLLYDVVTMKFK